MPPRHVYELAKALVMILPSSRRRLARVVRHAGQILPLPFLIAGFGVALAWPSASAGAVDYDAMRTRQITGQARTSPPWPIMVAGDSLVEKAALGRICGRRSLNAGIGGAGLADFVEELPVMLRAARPKVVVLAIGVNDAGRDSERDLDAFLEPYGELIDAAQASGATVFVGTIAPVAKTGATASWYDPSLILAFNAGLRRLARDRGLGVVDFYGALADPSGALPAAFTTPRDGVHLTVRGYERWRGAFASICAGLD